MLQDSQHNHTHTQSLSMTCRSWARGEIAATTTSLPTSRPSPHILSIFSSRPTSFTHSQAQTDIPTGCSPSTPFALRSYVSRPRRNTLLASPRSVCPSYGESLF